MGNLTLQTEIHTDGACDNIDVSKDGTLYAACHASFISAMRHTMNPTLHTAPTQVVRVRHPESK